MPSLYFCVVDSKFGISPMTQESFEKALSLEASDFEDALQYYSALQTECEMIITRNKNDFQFSEIAVYSPDEFLAQSFPFSKYSQKEMVCELDKRNLRVRSDSNSSL